MARYTCSMTVAVALDKLYPTITGILESCGLEVLIFREDYVMAREKPGQCPFAKLATVEVLVDSTRSTLQASEFDVVVKNEELPLQSNNHCSQVYQKFLEFCQNDPVWRVVTCSDPSVTIAPSVAKMPLPTPTSPPPQVPASYKTIKPTPTLTSTDTAAVELPSSSSETVVGLNGKTSPSAPTIPPHPAKLATQMPPASTIPPAKPAMQMPPASIIPVKSATQMPPASTIPPAKPATQMSPPATAAKTPPLSTAPNPGKIDARTIPVSPEAEKSTSSLMPPTPNPAAANPVSESSRPSIFERRTPKPVEPEANAVSSSPGENRIFASPPAKSNPAPHEPAVTQPNAASDHSSPEAAPVSTTAASRFSSLPKIVNRSSQPEQTPTESTPPKPDQAKIQITEPRSTSLAPELRQGNGGNGNNNSESPPVNGNRKLTWQPLASSSKPQATQPSPPVSAAPDESAQVKEPDATRPLRRKNSSPIRPMIIRPDAQSK